MKITPQENYDDRATAVVAPGTTTDKIGEESEEKSEILVNAPDTEREVPYSEKNSDFMNITADITSKFIFYPYSTLSIKTFDLGILRKIFRAVSLQRVSPIAEAISECIDPDKSTLDLTVQDFWSLMFWERINSYKKTAYKISFVCENPKHIEQVESGDLEKKTLENEVVVKKLGELTLKWVDEEKTFEFVNRVQAEYGVSLFPPTVSDMLELQELQASLKGNEDKAAEAAWLARLASNLNRKHGKTLKDRMRFLERGKLSPDLVAEIDEFADVSDHGISEHVKVCCATCKKEKEVEVSFDALSFFPDYK